MSVYKSYSDITLLQLLSNEDEEAFETIYYRYAEELNRFAYSKIGEREESEEIIQEIFVTLWQKRKQLQGITALNTYLFRAVHNRIISYYRSAKVREQYANNFAMFAITHSESIDIELAFKELKNIMDKELVELPERCQQAFRMSRIENMSIQQIAEQMAISPRTVENYITQALKHLRSRMQKTYKTN